MSEPFHIGFLIFPRVTQLDFTGPAQVLAYMSGAKVHLVAASLEPVPTDAGFSVLPTSTFEDCPSLQMICVPGGRGVNEAMQDPHVLSWLRERAGAAQVITSVCTGSLVLGAAGLLRGRQATTHWAFRDFLRTFGAEPLNERVVTDGNLITGGGVTAGIDFALRVIQHVRGADEAEMVRLLLEYDPAPIGAGGTPDTARPNIVQRMREQLKPALEEQRRIVLKAAKLLD